MPSIPPSFEIQELIGGCPHCSLTSKKSRSHFYVALASHWGAEFPECIWCVHSLQKRRIRRPLYHINNSRYNRDALCMGWNEVDREGLVLKILYTLETQMRHHALKHHFKSNLDFSWPKEERLSGISIGSHQRHVTQAPSFHSLAKSHRVDMLFASHIGYLLTRSTVLTANQPLISLWLLFLL